MIDQCGNYHEVSFKDITGQNFGKLIVLNWHDKTTYGKSRWKCKCDCGNIIIAHGSNLRNGHTKSCGCLKVKHNESSTRLYSCWDSFKQRCLNPNSHNFSSYGGRGIMVCEEWLNDYESFRDWSVANGYSDKLMIDRINNNDGYSPDNCRWTDSITQNNNTRANILINYNGEIQTLAQLCRRYEKEYSVVKARLKIGWSLEDAFSKPKRRKTNGIK